MEFPSDGRSVRRKYDGQPHRTGEYSLMSDYVERTHRSPASLIFTYFDTHVDLVVEVLIHSSCTTTFPRIAIEQARWTARACARLFF